MEKEQEKTEKIKEKKEKENKMVSPYEFLKQNVSQEIEIIMKDGTLEKGTLKGFDQCQNIYISSGKKESYIRGDSIKIIRRV